VPATAIAARTNTNRVIRAMWNAAASPRKSFTPWFATAAADEDKALAQQTPVSLR
jgi:pyrroline-5-carboxylate reductase